MGGVERNISRSTSGDSTGNGEITRTYVVIGASAEQICAAPESVTLDDGTTLPAYGSTFEGLRLDRINASPDGSGAVVVTAQYSKSGRFTLSALVPIVPDPASNYRRGGATATYTDPLPYAVKSVSTVMLSGSETRIPMWKVQTANILSAAMRFSATVRVDAGDVASANYAIAQQVNVVHELPIYTDGRWAKFEGADYTEIETDVFAFTYSWVVDFGVPWKVGLFVSDDYVDFPKPSNSGSGPPAPYWEVADFPGKWVRPPYHFIVPTADPNDDREPPVWKLIKGPIFDDQGWSQLPGMV